MDSSFNESLGHRIARLRLMKGMTQERLANIAHVSAQAVSKWENDQSYPDILLLPVLADTFGVTIDELLGRVAAEPVAETAAMPAVEPVAEPEPESEPEPEPELEPESESEPNLDSVPYATNLRIHIVDKGREAINLRIPLTAAGALRGISGLVAGYTEGVDIMGLVDMVQSAAPGTLIDIDDGGDRVTISLE